MPFLFFIALLLSAKPTAILRMSQQQILQITFVKRRRMRETHPFEKLGKTDYLTEPRANKRLNFSQN